VSTVATNMAWETSLEPSRTSRRRYQGLAVDGTKEHTLHKPDSSHRSMADRTKGATGHMVGPGGLIVFDNTLWGGEVLDPGPEDEDTRALQALNRKLANDDRISVCLLPIADGVMLARCY
jgi:hypothetical protein